MQSVMAESLSTFQSTPSVWRETAEHYEQDMWKEISIHSLRVEGDDTRDRKFQQLSISIHSLRVEGDAASISTSTYATRFQSTPSVWRETRRCGR